ncbi:hypothetical protein AAVH_08632 [Aphelenchoides avenae]|nr:hypothetical protein AAVH_08632 [Aphelenchus avenae]
MRDAKLLLLAFIACYARVATGNALWCLEGTSGPVYRKSDTVEYQCLRVWDDDAAWKTITGVINGYTCSQAALIAVDKLNQQVPEPMKINRYSYECCSTDMCNGSDGLPIGAVVMAASLVTAVVARWIY